MTKIFVSGEGGQGVRVISHVLATLLGDIGYEVTLLYDYDSSVRGAFSLAHLIFDHEPIENPVIDNADILLKFSNKAGKLNARKTIGEAGLGTDEQIPFHDLGEDNFGEELFGNMIALGRLIRLIDLELSDEELDKILPLKYHEKNIKAVHFGYNLREGDLGRGIMSGKKQEDHFTSTGPGITNGNHLEE